MKTPRALIRSSVIAFAFLAALPARAGVNRWTSLGPRSDAAINALAREASRPDTLYAATSGGGVFKSENGGETWAPVNTGLEDGNVAAVAADPTAAGTVYAATAGSGIFKTTDGAKTWARTSESIAAESFTCLAIDPRRPSRLYAGTAAGIVYGTTDGGKTWTRLFTVIPGGVNTLAVDEASTVYVAGHGLPLYRSRDAGETWQSLSVGPTASSSYSAYYVYTPIAVDASGSDTIYLGLDRTLYKTTDDGKTWKPAGPSLPFDSITTLALSRDDPSTLVLGTYQGDFYVSRDAAATWTQAAGAGSGVRDAVRVLLVGGKAALAVLAARGTIVLEGSAEENAPPWREVSAGLDAASVQTIAVSPSDSSKLLATDGFHPMRSGDGGKNWSSADSMGVRYIYNFAFSPASPSTALAGTFEGILRTDDGGASWQRTAFDGVLAFGFAFHPTSPETVYAATSAGVQKSTDGGRRWSLTGVTRQPATYSVLADRLNPSVLYTVYLPDALYYYGPFNPTIAKSTDAGETWKAADAGFSTPSVSALVMDSADTQTLYAGTYDKGVFKTVDGGNSWNPANAGIEHANVSALAADSTNASILYAATNRGIFRSGDAAASWFRFNDGLANLAVTALSVDSTGRHLYASTYGSGIFHLEVQPPSSLCVEDEGRVCYLGRFLVSASARPPSGNLPPLPVPIPQGERFGVFRLAAADDVAPDIFLKFVDGRALPGGAFWIFHAGLTRDDYTLNVTDTATGRVRIYQNAANRPGCGGIDTFTDAGTAIASTASASTLAPGDGDTLSLYGGRYTVSLSATDPRTGRTASGVAMSQGDRDGYFSLPDFMGDPAFPEVFVRVVEQPDGSLAFSHAGLTDLEYTLTVTNTGTSAIQTFRNDLTDPLRPCGGVAAAP